eukprot:scaffold1914_cov205-Amphora_coffeaeformis.AAC.1
MVMSFSCQIVSLSVGHENLLMKNRPVGVGVGVGVIHLKILRPRHTTPESAPQVGKQQHTTMLQRLALKSIGCHQKNLMKIRSFASLTGLSLLQFSTTVVAFVPSFSSLSTSPTSLSSSSSIPAVGFGSTSTVTRRRFHRTSVVTMSERKAGVASPEELKAFVAEAGEGLLVVDVRNPDASVEPGDQKSLAVAALPNDDTKNRPRAKHLIWDRHTDTMPLPDVPKDTPIITHCGGGGRGQKAKDFLEKNGFTKVLNGGGPKETDCWAEFGDK